MGGALGTTSANIAPVTLPLGSDILRRKAKEQDFSLSEGNKTVKIPRVLERKLKNLINEEFILEQNVLTDNIEFLLRESLGDSWKFDGFKCFKSILQFSSSEPSKKCFKIFQN